MNSYEPLRLLSISLLLFSAACTNDSVSPLRSEKPSYSVSAWAGPEMGMNIDSIFVVPGQLGDDFFDDAATVGVRWVRYTVYWALLQPNSPTVADPHFDTAELQKLHRLVDRANARNMEVHFDVWATPAWAQLCENGEDPEGRVCGDPRWPPHESMWIWWREFMTDLTAEFPTVDYWGVWNEPNGTFLQVHSGTKADAYNLILGYAEDAITAAGDYVVAPEFGNDQGDMAFLFDVLVARANDIDIIGAHYYGEGVDEAAWVGAIADSLNAWNVPSKPIWITESGYDDTVADTAQAYQLAYVYDSMLDGGTPQWAKTFQYTYENPDTNYSIAELVGGTILHKMAVGCFTAIANGLNDSSRSSECQTGINPF